MTFSELKQRDVINIRDGKKLGRPIDLVLNANACIEALVVPRECNGFLSFFKPDREGAVIPWKCVRQIGDDVILVEIDSASII